MEFKDSQLNSFKQNELNEGERIASRVYLNTSFLGVSWGLAMVTNHRFVFYPSKISKQYQSIPCKEIQNISFEVVNGVDCIKLLHNNQVTLIKTKKQDASLELLVNLAIYRQNKPLAYIKDDKRTELKAITLMWLGSTLSDVEYEKEKKSVFEVGKIRNAKPVPAMLPQNISKNSWVSYFTDDGYQSTCG